MRRVASIAGLALLLFAASAGARPYTRSYLSFTIGADLLTADTSGPVISGAAEGVGELGVGYQLSRDWVLEGTYGFGGHWQGASYEPLDFPAFPPPDHERVWQVTANTLFLRSYWARGGARVEYFKPQLSFGLGCVQVTRLLRNYPGIPPFDTSDLLAAGEVGAAGLFVFSNTFMGWIGARYRLTERSQIANDTGHMDGVSILLGFRLFLPSPRDTEEPEPPRPRKPKKTDPETPPAEPDTDGADQRPR